MSKDYYKILGVNKAASQDEIKAAFRRLAHQHHPDKKGGNEEKFKEANEAFQVLSDAQKRQQYDQFGSTFEQAQAGGGGFDGFSGSSGGGAQGFDINDLGDMFSGFGDIFGGGGRGRGGRGGRRTKKGADIQVDVEIDLKEAAFGVEKTIRLYKNGACDVCAGAGVEPGSKTVKCKDCGGRGHITQVQRTVFGSFQTEAECPTCDGVGEKPEKICRHCSGRGIIKKHDEFTVKIPAGIDDNEAIHLSGRGEAGPKGGYPGDLYLRIHVRPDARFKRDGFDLHIKNNVSFSQAALGAEVDIETLDGKIKIVIPEGVQSGQMIRLKGKGITNLRSSGRGDLYVEVTVVTPIRLSRKQKELLKDLGL
ncbi:MAG: molecular chaperone DnaJ [Candidatus Magasanikbacteria bacterium]|nr:molecular chaperone DnaJ [Candidatus Magasanikbacteria bacterium]